MLGPPLPTVQEATGGAVDLLVSVGKIVFVVEAKLSGDAAAVSGAIRQAKSYGARDKRAVPLVVVPYMGEVGRRETEEAGVSWLDLSGNANIKAKGLRIRIEGRPNLYKRPGRPATVFATKSSRVVRWLLLHPSNTFSVRELARASGVDAGLTSRVVRRLGEDQFVRREGARVRVNKPEELLEAWREQYDFGRHSILRGHIPARSGEVLLRQVATKLGEAGLDYAATGTAGAWMIDRFASFRIVTLFVRDQLPDSIQADLGFREEPRGANLWIVVPNDDAVFLGAAERDGIRCAHPMQIYLDLKDQPERADEAAAQLKRHFQDRSPGG